jgi:glycine amidinotransferase
LGGTPTGGTIKDQLMTPAAHTEWDPLEEVIVGTLDNFVELGAEPLVQKSMTVAEWSEFLPTASKPLSKDAVSKANAELQGFVDYLIRDGVKVHRPNALNHFEQYKTPFFESHGHGQVYPRETLFLLSVINSLKYPCQCVAAILSLWRITTFSKMRLVVV